MTGVQTCALPILVAGIGGIGSLAGAVIIVPLARRLGVGPTLLVVLVGFVIGNAFIPLAPTGAPLLAAGFLIGQQLLGDSCATGFDVLGRSVVQAKVGDAQLGRAAATIRSWRADSSSFSRSSWPTSWRSTSRTSGSFSTR